MGGIRLQKPPRSLWQPSDHGFLTWNYDPAMANGSTVMPTAGLLQLARVPMPVARRVTNIHMCCTVVGSTLTAGQCFAALFTAAGALVGTTDDQAAAWATGAVMKTMVLATPYDPPAAGDLYVGFWFNGTTGPAWARCAQQSGNMSNPNLSAPNFRFATADTGRTTTAPATIGTQTGINTTTWVALS